MSYHLIISRRAQKGIARLSSTDRERIRNAILSLTENPRPSGCIRLKDSPDWRIRVGNYRIVYGIADEQRIVEILNVAHRRDVYR
ncbi:MAG: type II toxin-antitoxin system RelE/ParE family toxin [Actinobacteria bacterium]|nr:type II toxin-antitoxin system RelE/ParE family toxin [Actinomycetota bacterium]MCA1737636.1 type II toxin-antitoxin system RelE/ParE family toxin [Actinomycetota bacterium]